jgi:hypothetical protein
MLKSARFSTPIEALALMVLLMLELSLSSVELFVGFACAVVPPQDAATKKKQVTNSNKDRLMTAIWVLSI